MTAQTTPTLAGQVLLDATQLLNQLSASVGGLLGDGRPAPLPFQHGTVVVPFPFLALVCKEEWYLVQAGLSYKVPMLQGGGTATLELPDCRVR